MTYNNLIKYNFVNENKTFFFFLSTWSLQNLTFPAGSPLTCCLIVVRLKLAMLIIILISSFFAVFKVCMSYVSLFYSLINVTSYITYILSIFIRFLSLVLPNVFSPYQRAGSRECYFSGLPWNLQTHWLPDGKISACPFLVSLWQPAALADDSRICLV